MNRVCLACPTILILALHAIANARADDPPVAPNLVQVNFDSPTPKDPKLLRYTYVANTGRLVQLAVIRPVAEKDEAIRTLRVEIKGDAIKTLGIVEVPVQYYRKGEYVLDSSKRNVSVFFETAKTGQATIKITPVGEDGKDRPIREFLIQVGPKNGNSK